MTYHNGDSNEERSYLDIAVSSIDGRTGGDASLVGAHCQAAYCNQLDFLPFLCQSCNKTFCLEHRSEGSHSCEHTGAWAARRREAQLAKPAAGDGKPMRDLVARKPCANANCRTTIGTSLVPGVHCSGCNRDYCLKHRLREDHECAKLIPFGARAAGGMEDRARKAVEKLRLWGRARKEEVDRVLPKAQPSSAAARLAATNKLKKMAKGDDKLAPEKRIYLYVEAEAETARAKIPKGEFFFSRDWVVGRVLDAAAKSLQVQNINSQSSSERDKLRVFHVEAGRVLDFSEKVGACLASGNTIVLLRGVGQCQT